MAGMILCLGSDIRHNAIKIHRNYTSCKGLNVSFEYKNDQCRFFKYMRKYDEVDSNYYESQNIVVCAVGVYLYGGMNLKDSLRGIVRDLENGKSISFVAEEIDGTFCLVIFLKKQNKCFIITDATGVLNTYFYQKDSDIYFSTSMLALSKSFTVTRDNDSILMFIRSGMFFDENTYFKEIDTLKPASIYEYDFNDKQLTRKEYWAVPREVDEGISFEDAITRITSSLKQIVGAIPPDESLYDFTGGYDCRFILSLSYALESDKKSKRKLNAFFFGPPDSREARIVDKNCSNLGIAYHNYSVPEDWPDMFYDYIIESHKMCDGLEDACSYATVLMTQKIKRKKYKYSVHGSLGELFRQRTWEFEFGARGRKKTPRLKRLIKYRNLADDFNDKIFSDEYLQQIREIPNRLLEIYKRALSIFNEKTPNTLQLDYIFLSQRMRRFGGRTITTANQIIQPICPFWFRRPLEISLALPPEYKKKCRLMRSIIEKESLAFAREKMINDAPFMVMNLRNSYLFAPAMVFFIRKAVRKLSQILFNKTIWAGLTTPAYDSGQWYRSALSDPRCTDLLKYSNMLSKEYYCEKPFNDFISQAKSERYHFYGQLGRIMTVEMTLREVNNVMKSDIRQKR